MTSDDSLAYQHIDYELRTFITLEVYLELIEQLRADNFITAVEWSEPSYGEGYSGGEHRCTKIGIRIASDILDSLVKEGDNSKKNHAFFLRKLISMVAPPWYRSERRRN